MDDAIDLDDLEEQLEEERELKKKARTTSCPKCGTKGLVFRIKKSDGIAFFGCPHFPTCNGTVNLYDDGQETAKRICAKAENAKKLPPSPVDEQLRSIATSPSERMSTPPPWRANTMMDRMKDAAARAPYRVARMKLLKEGKAALIAALKSKLDPKTAAAMELFLSTDVGQAVVMALIGVAGPTIPTVGKNHHVENLCEEFLEEGMALGMNEVVTVVGGALTPVLMGVVSALPEEAAKVIPRKRKRVASDTTPSPAPTEEEFSQEGEEAEASGRRVRR